MNNDIVASKLDEGYGVRAVISFEGRRQGRRRPLLFFLRDQSQGFRGRKNTRKKKSEKERIWGRRNQRKKEFEEEEIREWNY